MFICLAAAFLLSSVLAAVCLKHPSVRIWDLRCEYLTDPLGIDDPYRITQAESFDGFSPRLSWKISAPGRYGGQKACRVVVSDWEGNRLWDSGLNEGRNQCCFIPDSILESGTAYRWKVGVQVKDKGSLKWSREARFSTGLLKDDWKGKWIRHPYADPKCHIRFRKDFDLPGSLPSGKPVYAYLASIGYHELYVNGRKADDRVLAPAVSRLDRRCLYVTYDITRLLEPGSNLIEVVYGPGWSLNGFFSRKVGQGLLVQVYDCGKTFSLSSDSSWECSEGCSRNTGAFDFMDMGGECVDGTSEGGKPVTAEETTPADQVILSSQMTDPSRIIGTISGKSVSVIPDPESGDDPRNVIYRVDLGKEFTGFLDVSFAGLERGDTVEIMVSMRDSNPGFVQATYWMGDKVVEEQRQRETYIARGEDGESFRNRFNYVGGRYVHLRGLRKPPKPGDVKGLAVSSAPEPSASFNCADTLLNRLFALDNYTFRMCHTEGVTVDCPNRERLGYGPEGSYQTMFGLGLPYYRSAAHYVKNVRDWADVQSEDGFINNVAPQMSIMYGCVLNGTAPLVTAWEHYRLYGDRRILELAYPVGQGWLRFLSGHVKDDKLCRYAGYGYFLGEWVSPGPVFEYAETEEALFFNNCAYSMTLDLMSRIGMELGRTEEAGEYEERLDATRRAVHEAFFDRETGLYLKGDQTRTAFALFAGIVPDSLRAGLTAHLEEKLTGQGFIDIGSFGRYPFYKTVLGDRNLVDIVSGILLGRDYPGYGYFVEKGCTTFPEMWEIDRPNSTLIHTSYTGISGFLIKGLAGIGEGVDTVSLSPCPVPGLEGCSAEAETSFGTVRSAWERRPGGIRYSITVPFGAAARLKLDGRENEILPPGKTVRLIPYDKSDTNGNN